MNEAKSTPAGAEASRGYTLEQCRHLPYSAAVRTRSVAVNMSPCHGEDRRFESGRVRHSTSPLDKLGAPLMVSDLLLQGLYLLGEVKCPERPQGVEGHLPPPYAGVFGLRVDFSQPVIPTIIIIIAINCDKRSGPSITTVSIRPHSMTKRIHP